MGIYPVLTGYLLGIYLGKYVIGIYIRVFTLSVSKTF